MNQEVERLGAVGSSLCAVHCALCALLPAALSALGLRFPIGHEVEWWKYHSLKDVSRVVDAWRKRVAV
jgi:hypothetical protein